ncbi:unnamed protein product [Schistosoma margrebowiei]|uniref:Uncharacterized protein n=1 Tax=Schistosoma margrebowiei TaxID=48269 RepID=A0A183MHZ5_9TREM|nr:unnamed protein product [Schistosoma margrebowiei]
MLAYIETENKSSNIMNTVAFNRAHHSTTKVYDESNYWDSLVVLSDMDYLNDSHVFDEISHNNEKNLSNESNDDQEPNVD